MITFTSTHTRTGTTVLRPQYDTDPTHAALAFVMGARRFARVAGLRNAARALHTQGVPIRIAVAVLLRDPIDAALMVQTLHRTTLTPDDNLGDC